MYSYLSLEDKVNKVMLSEKGDFPPPFFPSSQMRYIWEEHLIIPPFSHWKWKQGICKMCSGARDHKQTPQVWTAVGGLALGCEVSAVSPGLKLDWCFSTLNTSSTASLWKPWSNKTAKSIRSQSCTYSWERRWFLARSITILTRSTLNLKTLQVTKVFKTTHWRNSKQT